MSRCFRSWSCSGSNVLKPLVDQHQLTLTAVHGSRGGPSPDGSDFRFRHQFEARLNNSWRTALFIKWYAVLINVVEACFAIYEIGAVRERRRHHRDQGRSRRNLHLVMATLMLLSNGTAIVGLLTANPTLMAPYYYLHVAILVLELNYAVTRIATGSKSTRQSSTGRSLATLAYITFNLLIMIGAEFGTSTSSNGDGDGWSTRWFSVPDWMMAGLRLQAS